MLQSKNITPIRNDYLPDELEHVPMWEVMRQLWDDHKGKRPESIAWGIVCVMDCFDSGMNARQALKCGDLAILMAERQRDKRRTASVEVGTSVTNLRTIADHIPTDSSSGPDRTHRG